jgi:hypothetical protein
VEEAAGHAAPGEPRRFLVEGRWLVVDGIEDRWYEGGTDPERSMVLYLRVVSGGDRFLLRYLPHFGRWQVRPADPG